MVKAGHIGHDGSFIRLGGVDDIYGIERGKSQGGRKKEKRRKVLFASSLEKILLMHMNVIIEYGEGHLIQMIKTEIWLCFTLHPFMCTQSESDVVI